MTAETTGPQQAVEVSSPANDPQLWASVEKLESAASVGSLDPYRERLESVERLKAWKQLVSLRGRRYVRCTLDSFECSHDPQRQVLAALVRFSQRMPELLTEGRGGVVLLGPPGTGKDHLLMGLMRNAILQHGYSVTWMDGVRLFAQIKSCIKTNTVEALLDKLCEVKILSLSDPVPPRDELTSYELSVLRDIIERRYSWAKATWITTNVQTPADAKRLFTEAVLGRLIEGATQLFCDWENYRRPV